MATKRDQQLSALLKQHEELQARIDEIRAAEKAEVIEGIRAQMAQYGITTLELEGRKRPFKPRRKRNANGELE
ncbi:H-NS histone family protein [Burkholderia ambifaria]|jgi:DNA-binding protein H-NS